MPVILTRGDRSPVSGFVFGGGKRGTVQGPGGVRRPRQRTVGMEGTPGSQGKAGVEKGNGVGKHGVQINLLRGGNILFN
jgi:hypothetical protein